MLGLNFGKIYFWKLTNPTTYSHMEEKKITHFFYLGDIFLKVSYFTNLTPYSKIVGNKAKGRISKQVFQENKARQILRKTNISCPLIRIRTCSNIASKITKQNQYNEKNYEAYVHSS